MSFITPSTALSGSVLPPSQWNSEVRDNITHLYNQGISYESALSSYESSVSSLSSDLSSIYPPSIGTITSDYTVGTADNYKLYKVDPAGGTISITLKTANPTGSRVDFVQTGSGTVLFNEYSWYAATSGYTLEWRSITSSTDGTKLAAAAYNDYIYFSNNSGSTWSQTSVYGLPDNWVSVTSSANGNKIMAVTSPSKYVYIATLIGSYSWMEYQIAPSDQSWNDITSSADGSQLAVCAFSGYIYTSTNSGVTWTARTGSGLRGWQSITSSEYGNKLAAVAYGDQIYTSTDFGVSWTARESSRDWLSIACSSNGDILFAASESQGVWKSTDSGVNWSLILSGAFDRIDCSDDGNIVFVSAIYGGTSKLSQDGGITWTNQLDNFYPVSVSGDGTKLIAGKNTENIYIRELNFDILSTPSSQLRTQYSAASVIKLNNTNWLLTGDLY